MGSFRRTVQILWSFLSLFAILLTASRLYPIPYVTSFMQDYVMGNETAEIAVLAILATVFLYLLWMFFRAFFARSKRTRLDLRDEHGTLRIQNSAVESTAHTALESISGIDHSKVNAKLYSKPEDTIIDVKAYVHEGRNLENIGNLAQLKINEAMETTLGVQPKTVNIKMEYADFEQKKETRTNRKAPRVR